MKERSPEQQWKAIDWLPIHKTIFKIQRRIYDAARDNQPDLVHQLQSQLVELLPCKLLSVKRVSQDNKGKKTAGVDGKSHLSPGERYTLASNLSLNGKADPVKRVMIPKPGTREQRPLGIPTIMDRAKQALAKLAMEPQWEALFESNSFGFRPGRKGADATWRIRHKLKYGSCWVYDADIAKCFDRINHQALLQKVNGIPVLQAQIKAWLKAGIFEKGEAFPNTGLGTPQGGVLSPLLANIALDGAQKKIWDAVYQLTRNKKKADKVLFIRYADDFVILSPEKEWLDVAIEAVKNHIATMGLEIKPQKTRILHTLDKENCIDGNTTFDFLGFTFSQRSVSKYKTVKLGGGKGVAQTVPVVLPSRKKIKIHFQQISKALKGNKDPLNLIREINPILRGWRNYYKFSDSRTYGSLPGRWDSRINVKLRHWIKRQQGKHGRNPLFWTSRGGDNWVFYANDYSKKTAKKVFLDKYSWTSWSLQAYDRITSSRSPYDGDISYWSRHSGYRTLGSGSPKREYLLRLQGGLCALCKKAFTPNDLFHTEIGGTFGGTFDHVKPREKGGNESWNNSQLLHKECHNSKLHSFTTVSNE